MVERVWNATFSMCGFATAGALGCVAGAVRYALMPAPMRYNQEYSLTEDLSKEQVSDEEWILQGMYYGSILGFAINLTWPVLLVGGIPLGAIYAGARFLQKRQSFVKEKN